MGETYSQSGAEEEEEERGQETPKEARKWMGNRDGCCSGGMLWRAREKQ